MQLKDALRKIELAFSVVKSDDQIAKTHEFFVSCLLGVPIVLIESDEAVKLTGHKSIAFTDYARIYVVYDQTTSFDLPEVLFILEHELLHILQSHDERGKGKDPVLWNIATDAWINGFLLKNIFAKKDFKPREEFLKSIVLIPGTEKLTEEEIYELLAKNAKYQTHELQIGDLKIKVADVEVEVSGKKLKWKQIVDAELPEDGETKEASEELKERLRNFLRSQRGNIPGNLEEIVNRFIEVRVPWEKLLELAIYRNMSDQTYRSWSKINYALRNVATKQGIAGFPGYVKEPEPKRLLIVMDTSGSISDEDLKKFFFVIQKTKDLFKEVIVIQHDVEITDIQRFEPEDEISHIVVKGRGGTSHEEVFKWIQENYEEEDVGLVVFLTDFESDVESIYREFDWWTEVPSVWLIVGNKKAIFGETINVV